eukprot:scaffold1625_cov144-Skeletonema_menzelii.AAC.11
MYTSNATTCYHSSITSLDQLMPPRAPQQNKIFGSFTPPPTTTDIMYHDFRGAAMEVIGN